jgi:hypothetical protein
LVIRRALADNAQKPRFVRTVHGIGYAFCGEAADVDHAPVVSSGGSTRFWLVCDDRTFVLGEGDNIIGRDRSAASGWTVLSRASTPGLRPMA